MFDSIKSIKDEKWHTFSKREKIAKFTHTMQDTDNAFRMIVIKKDEFFMNLGVWEMLWNYLGTNF